MSTSLPIGRVNRTSYISKTLDQKIGRLAHESDMSASEYIRHLMEWAARMNLHLERDAKIALLLLLVLGYGVATMGVTPRGFRASRGSRRQETYLLEAEA